MYSTGYYATDEMMREYVNLICSFLVKHSGASLNKRTGFPMKGYYVPVELEVLTKMSRSAELKITSLGHTKTFIFYMSRHKSPDALLHELQRKIDDLVREIIEENGMDQDKVYMEHHPLRGIKLEKLKGDE